PGPGRIRGSLRPPQDRGGTCRRARRGSGPSRPGGGSRPGGAVRRTPDLGFSRPLKEREPELQFRPADQINPQTKFFMSEINAAAVAKLREMTGAGLMDCKKALIEAKGDLAVAVDILRKKGAATAMSKSSREAKEGVIAQYLAPGRRLGVLVEVNSETDFVARNETFRAFADDIAKKIATNPDVNLEADREAAVARIRENIKIPRHARMEVNGNGMIAAYIHTGAKVGVLV